MTQGGEEFSEIESFQKYMELKIVKLMSDLKFDECDFFKVMLQKLNTIDILRSYLQKCIASLSNSEDSIIKKELSFAML